MDGLRIVALAGSIAAAMIGTLWYGATDGADVPPFAIELTPEPESPPAAAPLPEPAPAPEPEIPVGVEPPAELASMMEEPPDVLVEPTTGMRIGPLVFNPEPEPEVEPEPEPRARRARRATPPPPPIPRLHPDPGRHVIAVARRMIAQNVQIQGSCYRYISEVFTRAGHDGWRRRRVVYNEGRNGPYANLDLVRPGDWLYIVNHPDRTPVGTHSVLFVGWEDRARGYARVIEHSGWGAPRSGYERGYDVSRTYRITRPTL